MSSDGARHVLALHLAHDGVAEFVFASNREALPGTYEDGRLTKRAAFEHGSIAAVLDMQ